MAPRPTIPAAPLMLWAARKVWSRSRTVPLAPFQLHQPLFQADQEFPRLLVEHQAEAIVIDSQVQTPRSHRLQF